MKKFYLPLSLVCLLLVTIAISSFRPETTPTPISSKILAEPAPVEEKFDATVEAAKLHQQLELGKLGLGQEAVEYALKGLEIMKEKGLVSNPDILSLADFSQSSSNRRLYIIDLKNAKLLVNTYVAHGKNSGFQYAEKFSNTPESLQSSLGFYVTKGTYFGKHGRSLKLAGLESGINDKAEARAIVIHGAAYIGDGRRGAPYQGRSFGCPAVPQEDITKVIDIIEGGSTFFIYKPDQKYLSASTILNG